MLNIRNKHFSFQVIHCYDACDASKARTHALQVYQIVYLIAVSFDIAWIAFVL